MPEITPLGWFHTVLGIVALVSGAVALVKHKEIALWDRSGQVYLVATLVTAATALAIFQHGGFGPAHMLAVLTLVALVVGTVASVTTMFGRISRYVRAIAYSGTLLFHCIPAVTDASLRLPVGDPLATSIEDPIVQNAYRVRLVAFLVGITVQLRWIRKQRQQ